MKRIVIAHGWDGNPEEGWFPWLKGQLEMRGYEVLIPQLPNPNSPRIHTWVPALAAAIGTLNEDTYLVGHSMGCQAIARYLEELPDGERAGGVVFVAGFFKRLTDVSADANSQETEKDWLGTVPDFERVKAHMRKSVALFSDDDPWVPLDNQDDFRDKLNSEVIIQHAQGHFSGGRDGTTELPTVLEKILELSSKD